LRAKPTGCTRPLVESRGILQLNNISQFRINKLIIFTQYEKNILLFSQLCF
jgi:hypothetical protein